MSACQPKTGARCSCRRGVQRDNCAACEGTGFCIDFAAIRAANAAGRFDESGRCTFCSGGNLCTYCQTDGVKRDREQTATLARVAAGHRAAEIGRICASLELESDEGGTREEKAARILNTES